MAKRYALSRLVKRVSHKSRSPRFRALFPRLQGGAGIDRLLGIPSFSSPYPDPPFTKRVFPPL